MLSMENPLFVYFNIGNPTLCQSRKDFYSANASELVMGSYQHVVDKDHRLIFQPLIDHRFLGCWTRIEYQHHADWRNVWKAAFDRANPGVVCCELRESLLIEALCLLSWRQLIQVCRSNVFRRLVRLPLPWLMCCPIYQDHPSALSGPQVFRCRRLTSLRHALELIFMTFHLNSWPWSQELPMLLCGLSARPILLCPSLEHGRICPELV